MLETLLILTTFFLQDTVESDTVKSVMFKPTLTQPHVDRLIYRHEQGFFCDFEDQINKGRKLKLNLGVGEQ